MKHIVDTYACEWKIVVSDPALRERFRHFVNANDGDDSITWTEERGQRRPSDWPSAKSPAPRRPVRLPLLETRWVRAGRTSDFPSEGGISMKHGSAQIAVFHFASRGEWYATQNMCPHRQEMVIARGIIGDHAGEPKVACPLHKKTFSLRSGECLSGEDYNLQTFPVKVEGDEVFVELPPAEQLQPGSCPTHAEGVADAAE
jgi:nitrite reductase (NADH) large subunit